MEAAFAWIGYVAEWIGKFFPRFVVLTPVEAAVKYTAKRGEGVKITAHYAGWHVYWPMVSQWDTYPVVRQTDDLRSQTAATADEKQVAVSGLITYEVSDILKLLPTTFEPAQAIKEISLVAISDVCCRMTWDELKSEQRKGTLETKLRNSARKQLDDYGVRVLRLQLTDMSLVTVMKIIQTVSKDED